MNMDALEIAVGSVAGGLYLGFEQRATQQTCPTGSRLVEDYLTGQAEQSPRITIDLGSCTWVDSTFAGWIIMLHRRLSPGKCVRIANCSDACLDSLQRLRMDKLFEFVDIAPPGATRKVACAVGEKPSPADLELMLRAHEELAALGGDNARVFTPIVETLRRELRRRV
ncbi:MAG: STAS domain-containing protein [Phycisphaerae bacterium]|nr:STAS domain-containing protein [Phycisphaerae bacterium]